MSVLDKDWALASEVATDIAGIVEITNFKLKDAAERVGVTNLASPRTSTGAVRYEGRAGMVTCDGTATIVVDKNNKHIVRTGQEIPGVAVDMPDGRGYVGDMVIQDHDFTGSPQGAYEYGITFFFTGQVVES